MAPTTAKLLPVTAIEVVVAAAVATVVASNAWAVADKATPCAVVTLGALMSAVRLVLEAEAEPPIRTLPAVVPIVVLKVKVIVVRVPLQIRQVDRNGVAVGRLGGEAQNVGAVRSQCFVNGKALVHADVTAFANGVAPIGFTVDEIIFEDGTEFRRETRKAADGRRIAVVQLAVGK